MKTKKLILRPNFINKDLFIFVEEEFYRFEFKYEMENPWAWAIEQEIKKHGMKTSGHAKIEGGEYAVTSLYFDSWDLADYYEKEGGFLDRKKLRARIYEPRLAASQIIWLELKKKHGAKTHKKRLALSPSEWATFLKKGPNMLLNFKKGESGGRNDIDREIIWNFLMAPIKPTVLVRYARRPYKLDDLRVTFDRQIEACRDKSLNCSKTMIPIKNRGVIMEVKFLSRLPAWLERIIEKYGLRRGTFSKYASAIDTVY